MPDWDPCLCYDVRVERRVLPIDEPIPKRMCFPSLSTALDELPALTAEDLCKDAFCELDMLTPTVSDLSPPPLPRRTPRASPPIPNDVADFSLPPSAAPKISHVKHAGVLREDGGVEMWMRKSAL